MVSIVPWVEKYRPTNLQEVGGHAKIIRTLSNFVKSGNIPHLLFSGSAGTGKTSSAYALIRDACRGKVSFDPINPVHGVVLEKNASESNRLEDITEIKEFVFQETVHMNQLYKFVFLDEADNLSRESQSAYRRIIETAPSYVKFILTCNFLENLIDPIISRCTLFRFAPLPLTTVHSCLRRIITSEGIEIAEDALNLLYEVTGGDMRYAVNSLQTLASRNTITVEGIAEFFGVISPAHMELLMKGIRKSNLQQIITVFRQSPEIFPRHFLLQLFHYCNTMAIPIETKKKVWKAIADADYRTTEGCDHIIQIHGVVSKMSNILKE